MSIEEQKEKIRNEIITFTKSHGGIFNLYEIRENYLIDRLAISEEKVKQLEKNRQLSELIKNGY